MDFTFGNLLSLNFKCMVSIWTMERCHFAMGLLSMNSDYHSSFWVASWKKANPSYLAVALMLIGLARSCILCGPGSLPQAKGTENMALVRLVRLGYVKLGYVKKIIFYIRAYLRSNYSTCMSFLRSNNVHPLLHSVYLCLIFLPLVFYIQVFLPLVFYLKSYCLQSHLCNSLADLKVVVVGGSLITFDIILIGFLLAKCFKSISMLMRTKNSKSTKKLHRRNYFDQ